MSSNLVTPIQRWPVRLGNALAPALVPLHLLPQIGDKDEMMAAARRSTGLEDFGPRHFEEPLEILLNDISGDRSLHPMGRFFHRVFMLRFLRARLKLQQAYKETTQLERERIEKPIVILGLPRTGTTRLLNILAKDERHRALTLWESYRPTPAPTQSKLKTDIRRQYARFDRNAAYYLGPDLPSVHHLEVDGPEECIHLLSMSFLSWIFTLEYDVPKYHEYYLQCDQVPPYQEFYKILQYFQTGYKKDRWLLKSPTHIFGIDGLLKCFPDAYFVHTHRDPMKAVSSSASLGLVARGMGSKELDPRRVGDQIFHQLDVGLKKLTAARQAIPGERIIDVQYAETISDPMAVVEAIYEKFSIELSEETRRSMLKEVQSSPQHHKGKHTYNPLDFGYTEERMNRAFSDYRDAFDVPRET